MWADPVYAALQEGGKVCLRSCCTPACKRWVGPADGTFEQRPNARALTEALDAMRELSSLHASLQLLSSTGLVDTFKQLASHQVV